MAEEQTLGRIPVRPFSYSEENAAEAMIKELLIDYEKGIIYIKRADGVVINTSSSEQTINAIISHISSHPEIITNMDLIELDGDTVSIAEAIVAINKKAEAAQSDVDTHNHDTSYLKKSGDTVDGDMTFNGNIILSPINCGPTEPSNPKNYQLFFKILEEEQH